MSRPKRAPQFKAKPGQPARCIGYDMVSGEHHKCGKPFKRSSNRQTRCVPCRAMFSQVRWKVASKRLDREAMDAISRDDSPELERKDYYRDQALRMLLDTPSYAMSRRGR